MSHAHVWNYLPLVLYIKCNNEGLAPLDREEENDVFICITCTKYNVSIDIEFLHVHNLVIHYRFISQIPCKPSQTVIVLYCMFTDY